MGDEMTTVNKLIANQQNALQSTGPKSLAGRSKSAKNALRHGFYAAAIVAGESAEEFEALRASVYDELAPEGVMECRLVDRVVLILWRFDRVIRYETAVATNTIGAREGPLPPDPDAVTGDEVDICRPPPEGAPPAYRLAYARGRMRGWRPVRAAFRDAATALVGGRGEGDVLHLPVVVYREIGDVLGWSWDEVDAKWEAALAALKTEMPLAGDKFQGFVRELARANDRNPDAVVRAVRHRLAAKVAEYDKVIAEKETEADALTNQMRAARQAALSAGLYADGNAVERVMRMESHLTRQLGLTLDLLEKLRGGSVRGGDGAGVLVRQFAGAVRHRSSCPPRWVRSVLMGAKPRRSRPRCRSWLRSRSTGEFGRSGWFRVG